MVSEVDEYLDEMLPRQLAAEHALHRGDARPRSNTWSQRDPITLFGAASPVRHGWQDVRSIFRWLDGRLSDLHDYEFELIAAGASEDLAYTAGFEHKTLVADGREATYTLRVTHVHRREDGMWKIVRPHGDRVRHDLDAPDHRPMP